MKWCVSLHQCLLQDIFNYCHSFFFFFNGTSTSVLQNKTTIKKKKKTLSVSRPDLKNAGRVITDTHLGNITTQSIQKRLNIYITFRTGDGDFKLSNFLDLLHY